MFAYPCPFCAQRLLASPERVGQRTICPKCLKPLVIPHPEGAVVAEEGRVTVPQLIGDSPSTIFVDDFHQDSDEADAMDLSLPDDAEEFQGFQNDSAELLPAIDEETEPVELKLPMPVAESEHVGTFTAPPIMLSKVVNTAVPNLGGVGAGPAAFVPPEQPSQASGSVVTFQSGGMQGSGDIEAELAAAISMRMKPPPEPPSDLRMSTGAWLALTATGLSLWMLSMMRGADEPARQLLTGVSIIGVLEVVISYVWVAYLSGRRSTTRGLQALLPPVWLVRLATPFDGPGYRPLRFAIAGALLIALASMGDHLRPAVQKFVGEPEETQPPIPAPVNSPLSRLKDAEAMKINAVIIEALQQLATDQAAFTATPAETKELIAELKTLRKHESGEVRGAALVAYKKWAGVDAAKPDVIAVLRNRSAESHERRSALDVAKEYKDRDVARAVAVCLGIRGLFDDNDRRAADTLRAIGAPEAEDALLEVFDNEDLLTRGLPRLLVEIGGPRSIPVLRKLAETSPSKDVREEAATTANRIEAKIR